MANQLKYYQKIDMELLTRVSPHGQSLYFFIPKDFALANELVAGDRVEIRVKRHYKLVQEETE